LGFNACPGLPFWINAVNPLSLLQKGAEKQKTQTSFSLLLGYYVCLGLPFGITESNPTAIGFFVLQSP